MVDVDQSYASHIGFYQSVYGAAIQEIRPAGRTGATMFVSDQAAGDWSDAPCPDLVLTELLRHRLSGTINCGNETFAVRSMEVGEFVIVPPNTSTTFLITGPHTIRSLAIPYAAFIRFVGEESGLPPDGHFGRLHSRLNKDSEIRKLFDQVWAEGAEGNPQGSLWCDGGQLQLAAHLLRLHDNPIINSGGLAGWQSRRTIEYLHDHFADDVALDELAGVVNLSTYHFARQFKQSVGLPPHAYLRRIRCDKAKELLKGTSLSVGEVAAAVLYSTPQAFARMFRAETGASPSQYRRQ